MLSPISQMRYRVISKCYVLAVIHQDAYENAQKRARLFCHSSLFLGTSGS